MSPLWGMVYIGLPSDHSDDVCELHTWPKIIFTFDQVCSLKGNKFVKNKSRSGSKNCSQNGMLQRG